MQIFGNICAKISQVMRAYFADYARLTGAVICCQVFISDKRGYIVSGRLGDSCLADEDCTEAVDNSRCDDVNRTCECDVIAGYQQLDDTTCDIRKSFPLSRN